MSPFGALHLFETITAHLVAGDYHLIARLTRNSRFTEMQIRDRIRTLGIERVVLPPSIQASGVQIYLGAEDAYWICMPVWAEGLHSGVFLSLSVPRQDQSPRVVTIEEIGECVDPPENCVHVSSEDIAGELERQRLVTEAENLAAVQRTEGLKLAPPPELPQDIRVFAQRILDALVDGRYDEVWRLGGQNGMTPPQISDAIAELTTPLVLPPQGLPPTVGYSSTPDDRGGGTLEVPLWTGEFESELQAVIVFHRRDGVWESGYLYDILAP